MTFNEFLPLLFMGVMGLSLLIYVVLDGYDLGVGLLLPHATDAEKDTMINSIGPFWDANETWLVLGVGVLLVAFPKAHGVVLTALYLPVTFMLLGLVLRGVAFDFRVKVEVAYKPLWNRIFHRLTGHFGFAGLDAGQLYHWFLEPLVAVGIQFGRGDYLAFCLHPVGQRLADHENRRRFD